MDQISIFSDAFLLSSEVSKITLHPVHIIDEDGKLSPSALIPICEFGGNMSIMGQKINQFELPVCKSFKPKILNDQVCYEVDVNRFKDHVSVKNFNKGLTFLVDTNEDRQYPTTAKSNKSGFMIYLDTLGK